MRVVWITVDVAHFWVALGLALALAFSGLA